MGNPIIQRILNRALLILLRFLGYKEVEFSLLVFLLCPCEISTFEPFLWGKLELASDVL